MNLLVAVPCLDYITARSCGCSVSFDVSWVLVFGFFETNSPCIQIFLSQLPKYRHALLFPAQLVLSCDLYIGEFNKLSLQIKNISSILKISQSRSLQILSSILSSQISWRCHTSPQLFCVFCLYLPWVVGHFFNIPVH